MFNDSTIKLPYKNDVWTVTDSKEKMLVKIDVFPVKPEDNPYTPEEGEVIKYSYSYFDKRRNVWGWQGCYEIFTTFIAYAKPTTQADWVLYADQGWYDFKKKNRIILASS